MFPLSLRLLPASLCSIRVTGLHRSYGRLRLPVTRPAILAFYTCSAVAPLTSEHRMPGSPWLLYKLRLDSTRSKIPRVAGRTRFTRALLLPADYVKPSAFPVCCVIFGTLFLQGQLSAAPLAPRRLSCLRFKRFITETSARLHSRPVANGYLHGTYTHMLIQPFFQAATTYSHSNDWHHAIVKM
jgi:hypothetical protein